jgi:hypothetical protein
MLMMFSGGYSSFLITRREFKGESFRAKEAEGFGVDHPGEFSVPNRQLRVLSLNISHSTAQLPKFYCCTNRTAKNGALS